MHVLSLFVVRSTGLTSYLQPQYYGLDVITSGLLPADCKSHITYWMDKLLIFTHHAVRNDIVLTFLTDFYIPKAIQLRINKFSC